MLLCGLALGPFGGVALAQDAETGAFGGIVRDRSGAAVKEARILLVRDGLPRAAVRTDRLGEFLLPHVQPGLYRLSVDAAGFAEAVVEDVAVTVGETGRLALQLRAAVVSQSVEVRAAEVELPSLADTPLNEDIVPADLSALPIDGRRYQEYALLTPLVNIAGDPTAALDSEAVVGDPPLASDAVRLSVRGVDPAQNSFAVDGGRGTRAYDGSPRGGDRVPFAVPLEGVQEFQVRGLGRASRLGSDAGGAVHAITRNGSASLHGSAFLLVRNSGVGAADPLAIATRYNGGSPISMPVKPRDQREQFGGSAGGPVPRTQDFFYFVSLEAQRRSFPAISSPANPLFYQLTPTQIDLLQNRGVTLPGIARGLAFLDSLSGELPRHANETALLPRLDWRKGARDVVTLQGSRVRFSSPAGLRNQPVVARARSSFGNLNTSADELAVRWTHAMGSRWLHEVRLSGSRDADVETGQAPLAEEPHTAADGGSPEVLIAGEFTFGSAVTAARRRLPDERRAEFSETLSFNGRAHTVTAGWDGALVDTRSESQPVANGSYDYTSGITRGRAGGLVDFLTDYTFSALSYPNGGCPSIFAAVHLFCFRSYTQTYGEASTRFHTGEWTAFVRDGWRLTPRLRADAGVLYDYQRMPPPQRPNAVLDGLFGSFAATGSFPHDTNNLAPHASVAYAPGRSGRTVVRLDYSVHFGRVPGRVLQTALEDTAMAASTYRLRLTPSTEIAAQCASAGTNFGYPATYACPPFGPAARTTSAVLFAKRFQLPAVQKAELSVQREIGHATTVSVTYALAMERQLLNSTDINIAPSTQTAVFRVTRMGGASAIGTGAATPGVRDGDVFTVPLYTARVTPLFGPVTALLSNGSGSYNAAVLQVDRRATRELTLRGAWTFSKSLGYSGASGSSVRQDAQFDPFDVRYDRAVSNFDRPHKVAASAVWRPEASFADHRLQLALQDWSVAPIVFLTSGRPYSYGIRGGTALTGGRQSINGSGGATYLPTVGRNTLRLPWTETVDLRLMREATLRERMHCSFSAEAFNLFNHANVASVQQRAFLQGIAVDGVTPLVFQDTAALAAEGLNEQPFGTWLAATTNLNRERRLQFGARMRW